MMWRTIPNNPEYEASDTGKIRSKARTFTRNGKRMFMKGRVLKQSFAGHNVRGMYLSVDLNGVKSLVHRVIAMTFCPGYSPELEVNHINGNKIDNRACNLEWTTHDENMKHYSEQLAPKYKGERKEKKNENRHDENRQIKAVRTQPKDKRFCRSRRRRLIKAIRVQATNRR